MQFVHETHMMLPVLGWKQYSCMYVSITTHKHAIMHIAQCDATCGPKFGCDEVRTPFIVLHGKADKITDPATSWRCCIEKSMLVVNYVSSCYRCEPPSAAGRM